MRDAGPGSDALDTNDAGQPGHADAVEHRGGHGGHESGATIEATLFNNLGALRKGGRRIRGDGSERTAQRGGALLNSGTIELRPAGPARQPG
jgi:hypothetical protein